MATRNYGFSRQMYPAGSIVLANAVKHGGMSFSSANTLRERWHIFCNYAQSLGVKKMEAVTREMVIDYGRTLADEVRNGSRSASSAQNLVSCVNTVLTLIPAKNWESISPTKDCEIEKRDFVRTEAPITNAVYEKILERLQDRPREAALVELCREFGLRSKEASLLHVRAALNQAESKGEIRVSIGTKGGRERTVPVTNERQLEALRNAIAASGRDVCLVPKSQTYAAWRNGPMRHAREIIKNYSGTGLHDLRAAFACERYRYLTGENAPAIEGERQADKKIDHLAREQVSSELGHGRTDVTVAYLGSSK